eukprot:8823180-Pyramimonas_sp.AAC.1
MGVAFADRHVVSAPWAAATDARATRARQPAATGAALRRMADGAGRLRRQGRGGPSTRSAWLAAAR